MPARHAIRRRLPVRSARASAFQHKVVTSRTRSGLYVHEHDGQPRVSASIVLLSGGIDSASLLALCTEQGTEVEALFVDYGQRALEPERAAATAVAETYEARLHQASARIGTIPRARSRVGTRCSSTWRWPRRRRAMTIMIGIHAARAAALLQRSSR